MESLIEKLNPAQREAVEMTEGPVLIIAGAGSGKTRSLTHRVAYLIEEKGINPRNILAVTFTNKAANEMRERITKLLQNTKIGGNKFIQDLPLIGTFHSVCVRILRQEIDKLGYKKSFSILDAPDQLAMAKKVMKDLEMNTDQFNPAAVLDAISRAKNELIDEKFFAQQAVGYYEGAVSRVYSEYQKRLHEQTALDFDDMIMLTVAIFRKFPNVLEKYQNTFRYIMVDEYQDTNQAQYVLVKLLAEKFGNLCVVGDDWQGIYSWRGANIKNILDFEHDYPQAKIIKLEQNYRSTQNILDAAYGVISKNIHRKDKRVWTENQEGHTLISYEAPDEKGEAEFIATEIKKDCQEHNYGLNDFVVLYRTNAQSRMIEESMLKHSLPYRIVGGLKFYQRKEVKDVLAYVRLISNFNDYVSLERIVNEPKRNIGEVTLNNWLGNAKGNNTNPIEFGLTISKEALTSSKFKVQSSKFDSIAKFCDFIRRMSEFKDKITLSGFIEKIFIESGYEKYLLDGTEIGQARYENVRELLTVAQKFDDSDREEGLRLFLEEVALVADTDNIDQDSAAVHLMTLHSAKGLEFKIVFISGLEEGILPHAKSLLNLADLEEERRLMYVGITRAKEKVYLLFTGERNIFGSTQVNAPSRFLEDIPAHLVQDAQVQSSPASTSEAGQAKFKIQNFGKNMRDIRHNIQNTSFKDGDRVRHEVFGDGRVVSSKGDELTIAFSKAGLKKLSASIAPLKKIS